MQCSTRGCSRCAICLPPTTMTSDSPVHGCIQQRSDQPTWDIRTPVERLPSNSSSERAGANQRGRPDFPRPSVAWPGRIFLLRLLFDGAFFFFSALLLFFFGRSVQYSSSLAKRRHGFPKSCVASSLECHPSPSNYPHPACPRASSGPVSDKILPKPSAQRSSNHIRHTHRTVGCD